MLATELEEPGAFRENRPLAAGSGCQVGDGAWCPGVQLCRGGWPRGLLPAGEAQVLTHFKVKGRCHPL